MKRWLLSFVLVLSLPAFATNYTVKSGGGGSFTTMGQCATQMSTNGTGVSDTCTVFAGSYNESVSIPAGSVGNYKIFTVNGSDTVSVNSFTLHSHNKVIGNCAAQGTQAVAGNYGTCGFSVGEPSSPNSVDAFAPVGGSTDIYIIGNTTEAFDIYGALNEPSGSNTTYVYFGSNTVAYSCSTPASPNVCNSMRTNGDHQLIEYNDISHVGDGPYLNGKWIVLRHNVMHDIATTDCGTNSGNCHIDFMQADTSGGPSGGPIQFLLLENNTVTNQLSNGGSVGGSGVHAIGLFQEDSCGGNCTNAIVRFHKVSHVDGGGLFDDSGNWPYLKTYNNSYVDINRQLNSGGELFNTFFWSSGAVTNASAVNNIFYFTVPLSGFAADSFNTASAATGTWGHSLAWSTSTGLSSIYSHIYGSGAFTSDTGNLESDPLFASYAGNNFNLTSSSPARNAGINLTTVNGTITGSSTLVVNDASYFQDGYSITNVQTDCIWYTSVSNHVCIAAAGINYSTNTITLASPISAANGDSVGIYSISDGTVVQTDTGVDMGAYPFQTVAPIAAPVLTLIGD